MRKTRVSITLAFVLMVGVVGCAPVAAPDPGAPPIVPTLTPTATPTEEPPVATSIMITSEGFEILDEEGAIVEGFTYFDPSPEPAITAIVQLFGDPIESAMDPGMHGPAGRILNWSGFELWDYDGEVSFPSSKSFRLVVKTGSVNGLSIATSDGISIGTVAADVAAVSYRDWLDTGGTSDVHFFLLDQRPVDVPDLYPDYEPAAFSIGIWVNPLDGLVYRIDAPSKNWEGSR